MDGDVRAVVLQRGWLMVGYYSRQGMNCFLKKALTVKTWDSSDGLEGIVKGPSEKIKTSRVGEVEYHRLTEVFSVKCVEGAWNEELDKVTR